MLRRVRLTWETKTAFLARGSRDESPQYSGGRRLVAKTSLLLTKVGKLRPAGGRLTRTVTPGLGGGAETWTRCLDGWRQGPLNMAVLGPSDRRGLWFLRATLVLVTISGESGHA